MAVRRLVRRVAGWLLKVAKEPEKPWYGWDGCYCGCHISGSDRYPWGRAHNICCK